MRSSVLSCACRWLVVLSILATLETETETETETADARDAKPVPRGSERVVSYPAKAKKKGKRGSNAAATPLIGLDHVFGQGSERNWRRRLFHSVCVLVLVGGA